MVNCKNCGKNTKETFCTIKCESDYKELFNLSDVYPLVFNNLKQASLFFNKDTRTLNNNFKDILFTIDKFKVSKYNPRQKWIVCKTCNNFSEIAKCRNGYCKGCSKSGVSRKEQGKIVSKKYKGKNNPNYVHGEGGKSFRQNEISLYRNWRKLVLERDNYRCKVCLSNKTKYNTLHVHHLLPVGLFPDFKLDPCNGITLCRFHHIELHRQLLDIELLPTLYSVYKQDAQGLYKVLLQQPEFQKLNQLPFVEHDRHELIRVVPRNYYRKILQKFPEFAQQVLNF